MSKNIVFVNMLYKVTYLVNVSRLREHSLGISYEQTYNFPQKIKYALSRNVEMFTKENCSDKRYSRFFFLIYNQSTTNIVLKLLCVKTKNYLFNELNTSKSIIAQKPLKIV